MFLIYATFLNERGRGHSNLGNEECDSGYEYASELPISHILTGNTLGSKCSPTLKKYRHYGMEQSRLPESGMSISTSYRYGSYK